MGRYLNVGIIQQKVSLDTAENLKYLQEKVDTFMEGYHRPELIVGVEGGIGYFTPETIPGPITDFLCAIAKKHGIYFIPGTMAEAHPSLPAGHIYNAVPVINPEGEIIAVYRKMAPWAPAESHSVPGNEYVVFDIPEKDTKIGVQICYDSNFPEISRNETLMGAEVLVKLTMDPEELYRINKPVHYTRALENQAYFISTNCVGFFGNTYLYGHSMLVSPEGHLMWEGGTTETVCTVTLDLDLVKTCREYGTLFIDHYLQHLKVYNFPMPFANNVGQAPLYRDLPPVPRDVHEYDQQVAKAGVGIIGRTSYDESAMAAFSAKCLQSLRQFLKK